MNIETFRKLVLAFPDVVESAHQNHPDFRVGGKIFATLPRPADGVGMVRLTPEQQRSFVAAQPAAFEVANGAWGKQGCTYVQLKKVKKTVLKAALEAAYQNLAGPGKQKNKA